MAVNTAPITMTSDAIGPEELARAVEARRVKKLDGVISRVLVDGVDVGAAIPRDVSEKIKYEILIVGNPASIQNPVPMVPSSRRLKNTRIIGSPVGYPVVITVVGTKGYLHVHEELDPYGCSGNPVEDVI